MKYWILMDIPYKKKLIKTMKITTVLPPTLPSPRGFRLGDANLVVPVFGGVGRNVENGK